MTELSMPEIADRRGWHGILIERHFLGGTEAHAVTVKVGLGRPARRRWFADRPAAIIFAAEEADARELLIFDLGDGGEDE